MTSKEEKQTTENQAKDQDIKVTISKLEYEKLKDCEAKKDEHWDRLLRQQADFDNFRKRLEKERSEFIKFANEEIILELLAVLDDLERVISLAEKHKQDFNSFLKGVEIILAHLYELLKKHDVHPIDTRDKKFDPLYHEALMTADLGVEDGKIVEELQKGYLLNDRVIRTAKVKVAKRTEQRAESKEEKRQEENKGQKPEEKEQDSEDKKSDSEI